MTGRGNIVLYASAIQQASLSCISRLYLAYLQTR